MNLSDLLPDADAVLALEPDELGLRILQVLTHWPKHFNNIELGAFTKSALGDPEYPHSYHYPAPQRGALEQAIREAWFWLEGAALLIPAPGFSGVNTMRILSRLAEKLAREPDPRRALTVRRLTKDALHPKIREDVWALYHRGKFDTAVFEAMKAVEVAVREAAGLTRADLGVALMRKAFDVENGALTDLSAERAERQARSDLFAGSIGSYKNPHSHHDVDLDDPTEAAEIVMLANHLLRIVDARIEAKKKP